MEKVLLHENGVIAPFSILCSLHEADSLVMENVMFMPCIWREADISINGDSNFSVLPASR